MSNRLLFIYNTTASWIDCEREILNKEYSVIDRYIGSFRDYRVIDFANVAKSKVVYCWFGSLSFLPLVFLAKLMRKKVVVVAGGYDVAKLKEENYGAFTQGAFRCFLRKVLFKSADQVLAVSNFLRRECIENTGVAPEQVFTAYNCLLPGGLKVDTLPRSEQVLMVASIYDEKRLRIKGFDRLLELAIAAPSIRFTHVGYIDPNLLLSLKTPSNLILLGEKTPDELRAIYATHKVAIQLSRYESFCMTIVEAAACGCYPIAYGSGALSEVVEGLGSVIENERVDDLIQVILRTLNEEVKHLEIAKNTQRKFSFEKRRDIILKLLNPPV